MKPIKVVLYCTSYRGLDDPFYSKNGVIHQGLKTIAGERIDYFAMGDYLVGDAAETFLREAADADLILLDAWTHPAGDDWCRDRSFDPCGEMADFYWRLKTVNKRARIMAQLMECYDRVAVHREGATPFASWRDDTVNDTFRQIVKEAQGALRILVVEDNQLHIESARELLAEHSVTIVSGFDQALDELERKPDVVLTDCMIPKGGDRTMSPEGKRLAESQGPMPYGPIIALHAIQKGVKKVGIITAGNHHRDPFVYAFDGLEGFSVGDVKVVCTNSCETEKGAKNWAELLKEL